MRDLKNLNRKDFLHFHPIATRWMDNDVYGHINNVTYYSYFDTTVNRYLIDIAGFDIHNAPVVGYVVHSTCNYMASVAFPDSLEIGLRVNKLGNSSVTYGLGVFKKGEATLCAYGEFVHVFVDRMENKSVSVPDKIRSALEKLTV